MYLFLFLLHLILVSYHEITAKTTAMKLFPMLSSESFTVSDPAFKSLIRLGLIFVYGGKWKPSFIHLHVDFQFPISFIEDEFTTYAWIYCSPLYSVQQLICLSLCQSHWVWIIVLL